MIPSVIVVGLLVGVVASRRPSIALAAVPVLALAWGLLVATDVGADSAAGFALGAANAAVGVVFGVGIGSLATAAYNGVRHDHS